MEAITKKNNGSQDEDFFHEKGFKKSRNFLVDKNENESNYVDEKEPINYT